MNQTCWARSSHSVRVSSLVSLISVSSLDGLRESRRTRGLERGGRDQFGFTRDQYITTRKSEALYEHVSSTEFRHRVESIAEPFIAVQIGLQEGKRSAHRIRAKHEKQLEQVLSNTGGMYAELQALIAVPDIPASPLAHRRVTLPKTRIVVKLAARAERFRMGWAAAMN
jgi:hypothetical protein